MKLLIISYLLLCSTGIYAQKKEADTEKLFRQTLELVESGKFKALFHIATPLNEVNIQIDSAWVYVQADSVSGYLPYYTPGYSFPRTGSKGIVFDNRILEPRLKIKGRKERKAILYQFAVYGKNDNYRLRMDIQYDRTCYLYVTSVLRGPISYIGTLYPVQP